MKTRWQYIVLHQHPEIQLKYNNDNSELPSPFVWSSIFGWQIRCGPLMHGSFQYYSNFLYLLLRILHNNAVLPSGQLYFLCQFIAQFKAMALQICTNLKIPNSTTMERDNNNGGFHLYLLGFPFVYQFELQIELEPNLLVQNPVELIISPTFQIVLISCVT